MATTIIIKNSSVAGKVPDASAIQTGELAINLVDQKLYSKDAGGTVFELGGSGNVGQGPTPPPNGNEIGDLWWDGDFLLVWNGSEWEVVGGVTSVNGETGDVVLKLGDLDDVELGLAGPSVGDIIAWDGNNWVSSAAPPADISGSSIGDLNDVDVTGVNDGDILVWNESAGEWQATNRGTVPENTSDLVNDGENGTDPFITEADVNSILDGTTGGDAYLKEGDNISLLNNDAGYITDAGVTKIIAGDSIEVTPADGTGEVKIDVAIDASGVVINLDDLDDVNVPTPDDGDVLAWNGSEWVSAAAPPADISGSSINQLNDVDASGAADGDMLIWDGTNWVNTAAPTKTSDLTNDGENGSDPFITEGEVTNILNGLNPDGTPDAGNPGYLKPGDNVSELNNDAGYITDQDTAADSDKLCGEDCSYYLDYQNFINTPDLSGTSLWTEDSGKLYPTTLSNNVGIGIDTPTANLEIGSAVASGVPTLYLNRLANQADTSDIALAGNSVIRSADSIKSVVNTGGLFTWNIGGTDVKAGIAGASEVMRINPNGLVGIGTDTPEAQLTVSKSETTVYDATAADGQVEAGATLLVRNRANTQTGLAQILFQQRTSDKTNCRIAATGGSKDTALTFGVADKECARITKNGNVGIGTDSPAVKLEISGTTASSSRLRVTRDDASGDLGVLGKDTFLSPLGSDGSDGGLLLYAGGGERARIIPNGNVGIGTDTPAADLDIGTTGTAGVPAIYVSNTRSSNTTSDIALSGSAVIASTSAINQVVNTSGRFTWNIGGDDNKDGLNGASEVMRISSSGAVGIGIDSPAEKLHVDGKIRATDYDLEALPSLP